MKPVRIFRHVDCEGPGYLLDVLQRNQIPYELVCIDQGDAVSQGVDEVSGLVIMGGSMSANDDLDWVRQEIHLVQQAAEKKLPVLGHCLGGQIMAKALGSSVVKNAVEEIGWFPVHKISNTASEDWLHGLDEEMLVYHWHGEMFEIPRGAQVVLENANCPHQGFVYDNMLALQCHVEMTESLVSEWAARFGDQIMPGSSTVQTPEQMLQDLPERIATLNSYADQIYTRWLQPILHHA